MFKTIEGLLSRGLWSTHFAAQAVWRNAGVRNRSPHGVPDPYMLWPLPFACTQPHPDEPSDRSSHTP